MTQAQVRAAFIKAYPGVRRPGKKGYWYRCAHCGKWCGRPGGDKVTIKDSEKMEVDHIQSWSHGGSDELWNLQPLCKPCNRAKLNNPTGKDKFKIACNTVMHPIDAGATVLRSSARNNKVLKGLGITKRR